MPLPAPSPMLLLFQTIAAVTAGQPEGAGIDRQEALCLARNIYFEARGEDLRGQEAVASVTLNRVRSPEWPGTVCDVVYQPFQFSWTIAHSRNTAPPIREEAAWRRASGVAARALLGQVRDRTGGATHYVAPARIATMPGWVGAMVSTQRIGGHHFLAAGGTKSVPVRTAVPTPASKPHGAILLAEIMAANPPAPARATSRRFLDGEPRGIGVVPAAWIDHGADRRADPLPDGSDSRPGRKDGLPPTDQSAEQRMAFIRRDRAAGPLPA